MQLDLRKQREVEHSDQRRRIVTGYEYQTDSSKELLIDEFIEDNEEFLKHFSNMKFYSITRSSFAHRDQLLYSDIQDKFVLDYCCGNGEVAVEMAKRGAAKSLGIDISEVAIENASKLAYANGRNDRCEFHVMDAEETDFEDNTFDIIHEYGALHHLDLKAAYAELSRILKPEGKLVCTEALRHNPFIHYYRKRTPHLRTKWEAEHILGTPEIMSGLEYFKEVHIKFFHLATIGAVPFRKTKLFHGLLSLLDAVDNILLRIPYLQRMAWIAVFVYSSPKI
jgi:ubiquinone/menaquinone biosynthesis C-methylase UbiE